MVPVLPGSQITFLSLIPANTRLAAGAALDPIQFTAYTKDTTNIFPTRNIQYYLFADDTQSFNHCSFPSIPSLLSSPP